MNMAWFRHMLRSVLPSVILYGFSAAAYGWLVEWIYPTIAHSKQVQALLSQLPKAMVSMFGVSGGMASLPQFFDSEFFNLIWPLLLAVFCIGLTSRLVAGFVEDHSLANVLAAPVSRRVFVVTQATVSVVALLSVIVLTFCGLWLGTLYFHEAWNTGAMNRVAIGGAVTFLVVSGYTFLLSAWFDERKRVLGGASAVTILFYALAAVAQMSHKETWLYRVTLFGYYRPEALIAGRQTVTDAGMILALVACGLFGMGIWRFSTRDLSL